MLRSEGIVETGIYFGQSIFIMFIGKFNDELLTRKVYLLSHPCGHLYLKVTLSCPVRIFHMN